jgi:hypothetical protein
MITKFIISLCLLFATFQSNAQIELMPSGSVPAPSEYLLAQRYKALRAIGTSGDKEIYVGVPDLSIAPHRAEGELFYTNIIHFILQYDPATNLLVNTTNINGINFTTIKNNISAAVAAAGKSAPLTAINFMELQIRTQNATSAVDVTNLILNGQAITGPYTRSNSPGTSYWHLMNYDFGAGFTLTGTITLTGTFGSSAEANKVEFTFGSQPSAASPLPVLWGDVNVRKNASGNNELMWTTLEESKSESFLIQRSGNGRTFETIGRRSAQGTTGNATHYIFEDLNNNYAYYRIIAVDVNGKATYSKIVTIEGKATASILYNGNDKLIVQSTDKSLKRIRVLNAEGRSFISTTLKETNGSIDVSSLQSGIYFVQMESVDGVALRFFKQ